MRIVTTIFNFLRLCFLRVFIGTFTILFISNVTAQEHLQLIAEGERDFEKITDAFYQYWNRTGKRPSDLKKFKRWEDVMKPRLINGNLPGSDHFVKRINEYEKVIDKLKSARVSGKKTMTWEALGPEEWQVENNGYSPGNGRVNCITVDPNDPDKIFVGTASGGIWISENAGTTWSTTTDKLAVLGVTDIYINPANSQEVLALTGDAYGNDTPSVGLLKSTDGGLTWEATNFTGNGIFEIYFKLEVNPVDPDIMLIAGNGIRYSSNGGETWSTVVNAAIRFSDLVFHPTNPSIVYAVRQFEVADNILTAYKSTDSGLTWTEMNFTFDGLNTTLSRKALAVSPDNPEVVYILASSNQSTFGGLFKSSDRLTTLDLQSTSPNILGYSTTGNDEEGQGWYDLALVADPENENVLYASGIHIWKSIDAGVTWDIQSYWFWDTPEYPYVHADVHTLDIYNGSLYAGCDGGVWVSNDEGASFTNLSFGLNIGQFYRLGTHPSDEDVIIGGLQDNGSFIRKNEQWYQIFGADGMEALFDHTDPSIVYSSYQNGGIIRYSNYGEILETYILNPDAFAAWVTPYIMHPTDNHTLYFGYLNVWKSTDQGDTKTQISEFRFDGGPIRVLKQHQQNTNHLLAFVDDGTLYSTVDEGATWEDISVDHPGFPWWAMSDATYDHNDPSIIWATFSDPLSSLRVIKSIDGGITWEDVSDGLPDVPANCILSTNRCNNSVYLGTDIGVYSLEDQQSSWEYVEEGLPNVIVRELELNYATNQLYAATYGRGIWKVYLPTTPSSQQITFDPLVDRMFGDETFQLEATADSGLEVVFESSDPDIIKIEGTEAAIVGAGTVTITASQEGNCAFEAAQAVEREITVLALGVDDPSNLIIYPNPVDSDLLFLQSTKFLGETEISIVDTNGKEVLRKSLSLGKGISSIPVSHLKPGIYILRIDELAHEFIKK